MARLGRSFPKANRFSPILGPLKFDSAVSSGYQAAANSYTMNITIGNNSNRVLFVSIGFMNVINSVVSVTLGAQNFTLIRADNSGTGLVRMETWKLIAPNVGAGVITVNLTTLSASAAGAISYYGADQTTPVDASNASTGSGDPASTSVTTVTNGAWVMDAVVTHATIGTITPQAIERQKAFNTGAAGQGGNADIGVYPASTSVTMQWNGMTVAVEWVIQAIAIRPFTGAASNPITVIPSTATLITTTYSPVVLLPKITIPGIATLTTTKYAPTILTPRVVIPPIISLTTTRFVPTIAITNNQKAIPSVVALIISSFAPTILAPRVVTPGIATLTITKYAPNSVVSTIVTPGVKASTTTGYRPLIALAIIPGRASLITSLYAPIVTVSGSSTGTTRRRLLMLGVH